MRNPISRGRGALFSMLLSLLLLLYLKNAYTYIDGGETGQCIHQLLYGRKNVEWLTYVRIPWEVNVFINKRAYVYKPIRIDRTNIRV